jgi:TonB family protein
MKRTPRFALLSLACACWSAPWVPAQDVTVGESVWFLPGEVPEGVPNSDNRLRPDNPADLRNSTEVGYAIVTPSVTADGRQNLLAFIASTHLPLQRGVETLLRESNWSMKPAMRNSRPIDTRIWVPIIFNPKTAGLKGPDATPRLLAVTPILSGARTTAPGGNTVVHMKVALDAAGTITQAVPLETIRPALLEAIDDGLKNWRFAPARQKGQPIPAELMVAVICQPLVRAPMDNLVPPKAVSQGRPDYPIAMRRYGLRGEVTIEFMVSSEGTVKNPVIISSNNPAFDEPALRALLAWKFQPATRNGQPVELKLRVPIIFQLGDLPNGGGEVFHVDTHGDQSNLPPEMRFDTPPKFRGVVIPVYPYELRRDRVHGKVKMAVAINLQGRVAAVKVLESDRTEFGLALTAAMEGFVFDPALKAGHPVPHVLNFEQNFDDSELGDDTGDELLSLEKKHPERIVAASALDTPLKPVSQRPALFPRTLAGKATEGEALIEILINEEGHVHLPRVVSTSDPAFGYSAVQAVSTWWFEPPQAAGKAVVTRARVPFRFSAPAAASP